MIDWALVKKRLEDKTSSEDVKPLKPTKGRLPNQRVMTDLITRWKSRNVGYDSDIAFHKFHTRINKQSDSVSKGRTSTMTWFIAASIALAMGLTSLVVQYLRNPEIKLITQVAPKGQRTSLMLADGSRVILNAESSITYSESFVESRVVKLIGEAYFEVQEDQKRPFIVTSGNLKTSVLGTSFNIDAYPNEQHIFVTVTSGKVRVESPLSTDQLMLTPGDQAIFDDETAELYKVEVKLENQISWKDGVLIFDETPIEETIRRISKWYGVEILVNHLDHSCKISAEYENQSLANVLESLSYIYDLSYEFESEKVLVIEKMTCKD